ncbi:FtsX-like permease family protein [Nocardiopsis sp. RSe5-2]|uniref:FtsX-like permease family protein n=1 Tax=Nocardiopsis endophytica TaxID=3018445 RepID=A0ABT4U1G7_9ACTN|nr:ABC transporter permease [Nocardiopsis endophytica]MDA2810207.1 FtsX-like permease family protein [Nocardiopsis endophytica]
MITRALLHLRHVGNDLSRDKGVNLALAAVLVLSAFLMATGAMVMERVVGSVDQLFEEARPPHFLQMHSGDYDPGALESFAERHPDVEAWLIEDMLGYDGAALSWSRASDGESGDFSDSLIDNLFVTQNDGFDLLLDGTGAAPRPSPGEVYVPVAYQQAYDLRAGDELTVETDAGSRGFRIEGFVRDAQMGSSLNASTRVLVSEEDFRELGRAGGGAPEIIAEFRLADPSAAADFQRTYEADDALPKNGQAVTFDMIRLINAVGDGLPAVALVFASLVLIAIAVLSVRFVIHGTLEGEVREIGAMKAVGIPDRSIMGLYLTKYGVMASAACVVGGALAVVATGLLTRGVEANFSQAPPGAATVLVPVAALAAVFVFVMAVCRGVLGRVARMQVVNALVHGSLLDERREARRARRRARRLRPSALGSRRGRAVNRRLALLDLRAERGRWILLPVVFSLAAVLMVLPMNLLSTFASPGFGAYLGVPDSGVRADVRFADDVEAVHADVVEGMRGDDRLTDVRSFGNVLMEAEDADGPVNLRVDVGDHRRAAVEYLEGGRPESGEIALSLLNAERFGVSVGDELVVDGGDGAAPLTVSGVYQDVSSAGYTAKMQGEPPSGADAYVVFADMAGEEAPGDVAAEYEERFPSASVIPMREYIQQTMSYATDALRGAAVLSAVFGLGVALLITSLFLRLVLSRDRGKTGLLSAIGLSSGEIVGQVWLKVLVAAAAGTAIGVVFAATAGESLAGALVASAGLGIGELTFIPDPLIAYAAYPIALMGAALLGTLILTAPLRRADKSSWLGQ